MNYLTYSSYPRGEGIGSLLEYVLSTFFICNKYGLNYVHTDFKYIHHNKDIPMKEWTDRWNTLVRTVFLDVDESPSDIKSTVDITYIPKTFVPLPNTLYNIVNQVNIKPVLDSPHFMSLSLRQNIIDHYVLSTKVSDFDTTKKNIAVHIRRYMLTDCDPKPWRELYEPGNKADIFFYTIIKILIDIVPNCDVHIYSQGDSKSFDRYKQLSDCVKVHVDNDAMDDLVHLSRADILVLSKGSFSRVANFYSRGINIVRGRSFPRLYGKVIHTCDSGMLNSTEKKYIVDNL